MFGILKTELPYQLYHTTPGQIYSNNSCTWDSISYHEDTFISMFLDALLMIARKWNQPILTIAY